MSNENQCMQNIQNIKSGNNHKNHMNLWLLNNTNNTQNNSNGYRIFRKSNKSKRGQIEAFGLTFIVILISIGFFIFISFKAGQPKENPQKEFTNDKLANDFVLSILDVSVQDCEQYTVKDLIIDCARDHRIYCKDTGSGGDGSDIDSCIAVNKSIDTMLNRTFMTTRTKFRFYSENIYYEGKELINITNLNCTSTSVQGQRGVAVISLYPASLNVYLNMNICYT